ncbi:MAG: erythromycin esterase family protein [Saprospiraceae bacterium]|nr:erythromycin esterase family protein [Saprospiraceae bacterium]
MQPRLFFLLALLAIVSACKEELDMAPPGVPTLTAPQAAMVAALDTTLWPTDSVPLATPDTDLKWLDAVAEKRVVALGEATHGTREFFQMKDRIFRYLVEQHGFAAFAFEADFAESIYLDQYLQTGSGELRNLMETRMHFWTWRTEEVHDLLAWMYDYNVNIPEEAPLRYFGVDCQYLTYQHFLLEAYLRPVDPILADRVKEVVWAITAEDQQGFVNTTSDQHAAWQDSLEVLSVAMEARRNALIGASDYLTFEMHKHLLRSVHQVMQVKVAVVLGDQATNWRDAFMAENTEWILEVMGPAAKICVWAHNAHVARNALYGLGGAMGYHLGQSLGQDYAVIAFGFSQGQFTAVTERTGSFHGLNTQTIDELPRPTSANFLLHHAAPAAFVIDLDALALTPDWYDYFRGTQSFLQIGSIYNGVPSRYYRDLDLDDVFDWLVYYKHTSFARQL